MLEKKSKTKKKSMEWSYFEKEAITILTCFKTKRHKRFHSCGECEGCRTEECGKCINCTDMCKYGGLGKRRKKCVFRICHDNFKYVNDNTNTNPNSTNNTYNDRHCKQARTDIKIKLSKSSILLMEQIYDCI